MNLLYEKGYISDPATNAKSVALTEQGATLSKELFEKLFAKECALNFRWGLGKELTFLTLIFLVGPYIVAAPSPRGGQNFNYVFRFDARSQGSWRPWKLLFYAW